MLPKVITDLIEEYVTLMNEYTDLPSKESIQKLVRNSDIFCLNCLTKVTRMETNEPTHQHYFLQIDRHITYYFTLTPLQKIRLSCLLEDGITIDPSTSSMVWVFLVKEPNLYDQPDYKRFLNRSLLGNIFCNVLCQPMFLRNF